MDFEVGGLFGLLILIADIWAIVNIVRSSASTGSKILWTIIILILPVLGLIIWFFAGPRSAPA
ncbi:PLDc N-terminal domain-containing protein [Rhodospirillaceae bacterium SYSU D60014]|uniref:PLDc N-terminal domain-containing protein n=1 Tax=Virgifigura deserti TaxID=2268457 RepID=UPI000E670076